MILRELSFLLYSTSQRFICAGPWQSGSLILVAVLYWPSSRPGDVILVFPLQMRKQGLTEVKSLSGQPASKQQKITAGPQKLWLP